ncbi:MAG: hypothetical protein HY985_00430 [Magnetospirillum sp.]|nr:hypothetical protein [Magnetospirillum sp.]
MAPASIRTIALPSIPSTAHALTGGIAPGLLHDFWSGLPDDGNLGGGGGAVVDDLGGLGGGGADQQRHSDGTRKEARRRHHTAAAWASGSRSK